MNALKCFSDIRGIKADQRVLADFGATNRLRLDLFDRALAPLLGGPKREGRQQKSKKEEYMFLAHDLAPRAPSHLDQKKSRTESRPAFKLSSCRHPARR